jgi:RND family efflux transporter MFP subunit
VVALLTGCSGPYSSPSVVAKNPDRPIPVRASAIRLETIPETVSATGELFAEDQATIGVKVAGRIAKLYVDLGSRVEAGQVIAELEKEDYEFRVRQAEALVEQTRARLGLGAKDGDQVDPANTAIVRQADAALREARLMQGNADKLFKEGVASNVDYQRAGVALQAAEARYQAAIEEIHRLRAELIERRAALALARQYLADTVVRAPFTGAITRRQATLGEYLPVNAPVAVLVRWHPLRIRLEVPERQASKIRLGQRVDVQVETSNAGRSGRVVRLSPAIDVQNRSLRVEGEIPNEDAALRAGSFVEGVITVDPTAQGIAVPSKALMSFAGIHRIFAIESDILADRQLKLGRRLPDDRVEVVSGLKPGDQIVLDPNDRLTAGHRVQIVR